MFTAGVLVPGTLHFRVSWPAAFIEAAYVYTVFRTRVDRIALAPCGRRNAGGGAD